MVVLPVASGKGGVGKSLVASNLAIALSSTGKKVILVDLDLGASNLHIMMGIRSVPCGIGTYLSNPAVKFSEINLETQYENLRFVPGDAEVPGMANLKPVQKTRLVKDILSQEADYCLLDLGAGTSYNTIDFFLMSPHGILVTTPALTATLNAYLFLKNAVFRIIDTSFRKPSPAIEFLNQLRMEGRSLQKIYIPQLLEKLESLDPVQYKNFNRRMSCFNPAFVLNMLLDPKDSQKAVKLRRSCLEYLGVDLEHLGILYRDDVQNIALSSNLPILIYKPQSVLSQAIERVADKILQMHDINESPLEFESLDESYLVAEMEAEVDFETKMTELGDMLQTGGFTEGDLVETIKMQQIEIKQLRKENQLIKSKLVRAINQGYKV
jgi:flagellar biosynthesis protein FlhG